jgi:hypothetical protein
MKILHIEKKGPKLNTLERFHIYDMTKRGLQMNDTFTDIHNHIFDILIKTHTQITPSHQPTPIKHTQYIYTQEPQQKAVQIVPLQENNTTTTMGNCVDLHNSITKTCKYTH